MSVVIKGMKMPDNCSECQLEYDQMLCRIVGYWYEQSYLDIGFDPSKDKLPECPLVYLGYSEYTITGYDLETFRIGGHDLRKEFNDHIGEYCWIRITT